MRGMTIGMVAGLLVSTSALAGPKAEAPVGIGVGSTVGGTSGLLVEKHLSEDFGLEFALGAGLGGGGVALGAGVYGVKPLITSDSGGGGSLYFGADMRRWRAGSVDVGGAVGLQGDVFVTPGLSVWAKAGLSFWYLGEDAAAGTLGGSDGSGYAVRLAPSHPAAMLGFTWWVGQ